MKGWFEGQLSDADEIDADAMEATGHIYGCVSTKTVLHEGSLCPRRQPAITEVLVLWRPSVVMAAIRLMPPGRTPGLRCHRSGR